MEYIHDTAKTGTIIQFMNLNGYKAVTSVHAERSLANDIIFAHDSLA